MLRQSFARLRRRICGSCGRWQFPQIRRHGCRVGSLSQRVKAALVPSPSALPRTASECGAIKGNFLVAHPVSCRFFLSISRPERECYSARRFFGADSARLVLEQVLCNRQPSPTVAWTLLAVIAFGAGYLWQDAEPGRRTAAAAQSEQMMNQSGTAKTGASRGESGASKRGDGASAPLASGDARLRMFEILSETNRFERVSRHRQIRRQHHEGQLARCTGCLRRTAAPRKAASTMAPPNCTWCWNGLANWPAMRP